MSPPFVQLLAALCFMALFVTFVILVMLLAKAVAVLASLPREGRDDE